MKNKPHIQGGLQPEKPRSALPSSLSVKLHNGLHNKWSLLSFLDVSTRSDLCFGFFYASVVLQNSILYKENRLFFISVDAKASNCDVI